MKQKTQGTKSKARQEKQEGIEGKQKWEIKTTRWCPQTPGLSLLLNPPTTISSTFLTGADCGLLLTCPNHLNLLSLILVMIFLTSSSALYTPLGIMSTIVLPQVHLIILNSLERGISITNDSCDRPPLQPCYFNTVGYVFINPPEFVYHRCKISERLLRLWDFVSNTNIYFFIVGNLNVTDVTSSNSVFSRLTLRLFSFRASFQFSSLLFKSSANFETSILDDITESLFFKHLRASEDLAEETSKPGSPHFRLVDLRVIEVDMQWYGYYSVVLNHGLSIWTLIEIFLKHLDSLSRHIINLTAEGDLRKFSDIGAWYAIEDCAQYEKKCRNPTSAIFDETIANPNAQIVGDDMVRVQVPRCMARLDYDEHVDSLSTIDNEVWVISPESTIQSLPSFEEYTSPVTYPGEVEKTLGTPIEIGPMNETKLEEVGLNCSHNTPLSSREVPSFDGPEPQPLLNSPSLDVSLIDIISPKLPIKPHSPDSSRMKVVDYLTTQTPPSPHVANSHLKGVYSYYNPESKEVSPIGEELSLFDRPNKEERGRILEAHRLESILQQQISQCMAPSHHNGDATEYVHRVGRTAHLGEKGDSLLFIQPIEVDYLEELKKHGVKQHNVKN
ncbi:hypothetical protein Tco_0828271 [Tanacetum coccineum]